jgi:hypothetical protein
VVDKVALGQVFSEYFGFPCQSSFHQLLHNHHHLIIWGLYNRPEVAAVPRDLVPPHKIIIIMTNRYDSLIRMEAFEISVRMTSFSGMHHAEAQDMGRT